MNIQFEYLYRDAGNFKSWGEIVFSNPSGISIEAATKKIRQELIENTYFVAKKVNVPDLHFPDYKANLDHDWHEFHAFVETNEFATDKENRTIEEFLRKFHLL